MKPKWKSAPEWAKWLAQDYNGSWYWYSHKPRIYTDLHAWGINDPLAKVQRAYRDCLNHEWQSTLEKRPSKKRKLIKTIKLQQRQIELLKMKIAILEKRPVNPSLFDHRKE